ncbi:hypothetical protein [Furfurilactobacillus siliginis]|uniref:Helicase Helix-turn-helix domain-containing protein n=1 Tax=Furfurilactobacillus siliginis TaxID=348151 RepID=A0A510VLI2_9LACO|nr:hypothetical protein [Furfurilactobacillus siliginis]GEK27784.1 hypothetical protein LSI01_00950 [Furfurilactobacillus siliginis]
MDSEFLYALLSTTQTRRPKVIFNCLRGVKTVSILYWSLRYGLLSWLNTVPTVSWEEFTNAIETLKNAGRIVENDDDQLLIVDDGQSQVELVTQLYPENLRERASEVHQRQLIETTLLAIQATSQQSYQAMQYFPLSVTEQARKQVRRWFRQPQQQPLSQAITNWLQTLSAADAQLFVSQLVGHEHPGLTFTQLASQLDQPEWQLRLRQAANWMSLVNFAEQLPPQDGLHALIKPQLHDRLSKSVRDTLAGVLQGYSREAISSRRRLKFSTVSEHLLTAAILLPMEDFPYQKCLTQTDIKSLLASEPANIDDWDFNQQEAVTDYFTFRLVQIWETKNGR